MNVANVGLIATTAAIRGSVNIRLTRARSLNRQPSAPAVKTVSLVFEMALRYNAQQS